MNLPLGFIKYLVFSSNIFLGITGSITYFLISFLIVSFVTPSSCWVEIKTVSTLTGITFPFSSLYSTVTWVFPSGLKYLISPFFLTSVNFRDNFKAIKWEKGNNSSVSFVA